MEVISDSTIGGSNFNQYNFFENYEIDINKAIIFNLKKQIETRDFEIFNSQWRKDKGYYVKDIQSRTTVTKYGPVTYVRRRYKYFDHNKNRYFYTFLVDKEIQVQSLERISIHLKIKILEEIASGARQSDILKLYQTSGISKMSISNIIRQFDFVNLYDLDNFIYDKVPIKDNLYIWVDETFVRLRNKNRKICTYRFRLVTFHTGHKNNYNKRKQLANKRAFCIVQSSNQKIKTDQFVQQVYAMANKFYLNIDKAKIIVGGDGAQWIEETASQIGGNYVLDLFHATRSLHWTLKRKQNNFYESLFKEACSLLRAGKYHELIKFIKQCDQYMLKTEHKQKLLSLITYFNNKKQGIINQGALWNLGVNAEGQISHIIKWLLSYGAKTFNIKTFHNMLHIRLANINGTNPVNLLRTEIESERKEEYAFFRENNWKQIKSGNEYYNTTNLDHLKSSGQRIKYKLWISSQMERYLE